MSSLVIIWASPAAKCKEGVHVWLEHQQQALLPPVVVTKEESIYACNVQHVSSLGYYCSKHQSGLCTCYLHAQVLLQPAVVLLKYHL